MNDITHINKAVSLIEEKLNWGSKSEWTNSSYEQLSLQIQETTGVLVSVLTLKRLFGKIKTSVDYTPQITTKNTLAQYLGFKNWGDFIQFQTSQLGDQHEINQKKNDHEKFILKRSSRKGVFASRNLFKILILVIALASILTAIVLNHGSNDILFEGKNLIGLVPLHSSFYYDVTKTDFNNFAIDGKTEEFPVSKDNHFQTIVYNLPGYYNVKLLAEGKQISSQKVHALSSGWVAVYQAHLYNKLLPLDPIQKDSGRLYIPPVKIGKVGFNTNKEYWVAYKNIREFNVSADNFTLETKLKNNFSEGGLDCYDVIIEVLGEHSRAHITFVRPGCKKFGKVEVSEVSLNNIFHEIDFLGKDFNEWREVKIEIKNKKLRVYYEGIPLPEIKYSKEIGLVKGIMFIFKGTGSVDYVKIFNNSKKRLVYQESFEE